MSDKQKPLASIEAEKAVLGSIFFDSNQNEGKAATLAEVANVLSASDFYRGTHSLVYKAMLDLQQNEKPIDLVSITDYFERRGELEKIGGLPFLTQLADSQPTAANILHYAEIVRDYARRRVLADKAREINQLANDETADITESISKVQEELAAAMASDSRAKLHPMQEVMQKYYGVLNDRANGKKLGIKTGFDAFDKMTNRLQNGSTYVIAARPAMGKSALALNIAANVCKQGYHVLYFSLEMPRVQVVDRLIASTATVSLQNVKNIKNSGMQGAWNRIIPALSKIAGYRLEIDDRGNLPYSQIASKAAAMKAGGLLDLIIIDHVQIMGTDKSKHYSNRANELDDITGQLKALAMRLDVPIIILSQLSRENEKRDDKRPKLSDMRESGGIEQNADVVTAIYRQGYYDRDNKDGRAEWLVLKSRDGQTGTVKLKWRGAYTTFIEDYGA